MSRTMLSRSTVRRMIVPDRLLGSWLSIHTASANCQFRRLV